MKLYFIFILIKIKWFVLFNNDNNKKRIKFFFIFLKMSHRKAQRSIKQGITNLLEGH